MLISDSVLGQNDRWWDNSLKIEHGQVLKTLLVDPNKVFKIKNEDKELNWYDKVLVVNSDILINNDTLNDLQFTKATLIGDTLDILIYQMSEAYDQRYKIKIVKDKYIIAYDFCYPVDTEDRIIKTLDYKVILNTKLFKRGEVISDTQSIKENALRIVNMMISLQPRVFLKLKLNKATSP